MKESVDCYALLYTNSILFSYPLVAFRIIFLSLSHSLSKITLMMKTLKTILLTEYDN